jgi:cytochrome c-type biogenesis protein CcmF
VALGEPLDGEAWSVRVHVKPGVRWIWLGGAWIALGAALAAAGRRYRTRAKAAASAAVPAGG